MGRKIQFPDDAYHRETREYMRRIRAKKKAELANRDEGKHSE